MIFKRKLRTRKIFGIIAAVAAFLVLLGTAVFYYVQASAGWRDFASLEEWNGWLAAHPISYPATVIEATEELQLDALADGYLVSQQIVILENEGKKDPHIGLLIELLDGYYYAEIQSNGAWVTVKLYGK